MPNKTTGCTEEHNVGYRMIDIKQMTTKGNAVNLHKRYTRMYMVR